VEGDANTALLAEDTVAMPGQQAKAAVKNKIPFISHKRF
jgi:hypothetical protein